LVQGQLFFSVTSSHAELLIVFFSDWEWVVAISELKLLNMMLSWNVVSWNAILAGVAVHGHGNKVLEHFESMCNKGVELIDLTFLCHLWACCYATLVDEGPAYHGSIWVEFTWFLKNWTRICVFLLSTE
jgi:hypothetical protein